MNKGDNSASLFTLVVVISFLRGYKCKKVHSCEGMSTLRWCKGSFSYIFRLLRSRTNER